MKEKKQNVENETPQEETLNNSSRRGFIGHLTKGAIAAAAIGAVGAKPFLGDKSSAVGAQGKRELPSSMARAVAARDYRINTAIANFNSTVIGPRPDNGDEALYAPRYFASYTKGLPHHSNGEVDPPAYLAMLAAVNSGIPADWNAIPLGANPSRKFVNPQSAYAFDLEGKDSFSFTIPPAPTFASREEAAEIAENYWMALLRDVPFNEYATNPIAIDAAADLTLFGADFKGPKVGGVVTPNTLFRGTTPGDLNGAFLSQFFVLENIVGANTIDQQVRTVQPPSNGGADYMMTFSKWLEVQQGVPQPGDILDPIKRYLRNGRDTGQWVHVDALYQAYFQALLVLLGKDAPFDAGNPYANNPTQVGFGTFGGPHILSLLTEVATRALKAVWNQKWTVHRRLRPEVFAARCDRTSRGITNYPVHPEILNSLNSSTRLGKYFTTANKLLPMAFPEGSPLHPAYGAGHATVAGACSTILKAWFDESFVIPNPHIVADGTGLTLALYSGPPLTLGGECNKIAANVANSRNIAGVHWRSDSFASLRLGEAVAISILRDQKASYNEPFGGFSFTNFDGNPVTI